MNNRHVCLFTEGFFGVRMVVSAERPRQAVTSQHAVLGGCSDHWLTSSAQCSEVGRLLGKKVRRAKTVDWARRLASEPSFEDEMVAMLAERIEQVLRACCPPFDLTKTLMGSGRRCRSEFDGGMGADLLGRAGA